MITITLNSEDIVAIIGLLIALLCLGHMWGKRTEAWYWSFKGESNNRTPVYHKGKYYYVLPSNVYMDWLLGRERLERLVGKIQDENDRREAI